MARFVIFISTLLIQLLPALHSTAQYKFEKSILYNKDNGLPTNDIRTVTKSEDGFMWIGTREGLARFDGLQFHLYKPEEGNPRSLLSKDVNAVLSDKKQVWVGTSMGISVLDIYTGHFHSYQFDGKRKTIPAIKRQGMEVSSIIKDKAGDIWIGTRQFGVCRYDRKKDDFVFYPYIAPDSGGGPAGYNTVLSMEYSRKNDSIIWAGTIAGLLEINKYSGKVTRYYYWNVGTEGHRHVNAFRRIYYHDDGLLYAGTWRAGVNIYNPYDHTLKPMVPDGSEELLQNAIGSLVRKSEYEIWITSSVGLVVYNTAAQQITFRKTK